MSHPNTESPIVADASRVSSADYPFIGSGPVMRDLIRQYDWSTTPLGPISTWPASLKTTTAIVLNSKHPMFIWWGPDLIQLYNDAYLPSFGEGKHPAALGQRGIECWPEIWHIIGPQIQAVLNGENATWYEDSLVPIWRNGRIEEVYWTYTYTPILDDQFAISGVLVTCIETTAQILAKRRQQTLALLEKTLTDSMTESDVLAQAAKVAESNPTDIRFLIANQSSPVPADADPCITLTAALPGRNNELALSFGTSPQLPLDAPYLQFLEQFTAAVVSALSRAENTQARRIAAADRDRLLMDAPVGTAVLIGEDLVFELANQVYSDIVGREHVVGKRFAEVFPELVGTPVYDIFRRVYRTGTPYISGETHIPLRLDGYAELQDRFYSYNLVPLRNPDYSVYGLMVIAVDITPKVVARQEIERLNADLKVALRMKDEFLAMLGHELRNPLAPIVTALQIMKLRDTTTSREQAVIQRQVDHLVRLVDDLLDVSKITRGKVELRPDWVELRDVLGNAVEMADYLLEQKSHRLTVQAPPVKWYGDPARLAQIVANLLTNAARYTSERGNIQLIAGVHNDEIEISVQDNGIGISAELLPHIFDLFVQGRRTPDRAEGGLGIGLALVKNLVHLHGGRVTATSAGKGQGSTFTITLPIESRNNAQQTAPANSTATPVALGKSVLIVDDNRDAAESLAEVLRVYGHDVAVAYDPMQAIEKMTALLPDAAILDIGLPGMDGYELARKLQEIDGKKRCRLIALSGYGQEHDRQRSMRCGFVAHLIKPVDTAALQVLLST